MYKNARVRSLRLESMPRSFWYSLAFAGVFLGSVIGWFLIQHSSQIDTVGLDVVIDLGAFASVVIVWLGDKRSSGKHHTDSAPLLVDRRLHFWVPLAFSLAILIYGVGRCIITYIDLDPTAAGPPILGMIVMLGKYPALLAGIFLLPRNTLSGKVPLRFVMDSLLLIMALVTCSWYFLLGPILLGNQGADRVATAINTGNVVCDLLVLSCFILLSRSVADHGLRTAIRVLSLVVVMSTLLNSEVVFRSFHGATPDLTWVSLGWIGEDFAIALALQTIRWLSTRTTTTAPQATSMIATPIWRSLLAYALVPVVIGLAFFVWTTDRTSALAIGTYVCSVLLLAVIFAKQFVAIREIHGLNLGFQRLQRIIEEKNARLEALATTDPLTELPNHRALVAALDQELARSHQYQRSCSLLFFDLDHFKALNDGYGHAGGDIALREFGALLRASLPVLNIVGRWGGEEFLVLLPEQDAAQAAITAEHLRSAVANHVFSLGGGMRLTTSIGVASSPAHGLQQQELLQAADSAMYGAKKLGRNQVRLIDDPAVMALLATDSVVEGRDEAALIGTVHALALLVEKRDLETGEHAQHVGELLLHLATSLGLSEAEAQLLSVAGRLHDVGKIVVPDSILQKQEALSEQELACMHQHAQVGADVVSSIPSLRVLAPIIHAHHEWWNGMGYPDQLAGDAIPYGARLLAIVDAYVSMTYTRSHQEGHEQAWTLTELQRGAGTQFDPAIVEPFIRLLPTLQSIREEVAMA